MQLLIIGEGNMQKFFSKTMPIIGHVAQFLTILAGGAMTYMSLRIVSSKGNENNSPLSISLSVLGTILSSIMSVVMYIYSDATKMLTELGQKIDIAIAKVCHKNYEAFPTRIENSDRIPVCIRKPVSLLVIGFVSSNVIIVGINTYQSSILLVEGYLGLYPEMPEAEIEEYRNILRWLVVYVFVFAGGYRALAFEGSFAAKLVKGITSRFYQDVSLQHNAESPTNTNSDASESPTNTNSGVYFQYTNVSSTSQLEALQSTTSTHGLEAQPAPLLLRMISS